VNEVRYFCFLFSGFVLDPFYIISSGTSPQVAGKLGTFTLPSVGSFGTVTDPGNIQGFQMT
jgi:hypothetical protein